MPHFTISQQEALKVLDKHTIVSAGAGSGKTAVLTTRIKNIIESGVSPLNILVLTFTQKAAEEMKIRVQNALASSNNLKDMIPLVDLADISTIDAFTMSLCKKYFNKLNINPNLNILDENVYNFYKNKIIDETFETMYGQDETFKQFVCKYTDKDDDNLKNIIFNILNKIELIDNTKKFLIDAQTKYFDDKYLFFLEKEAMNYLKTLLDDFYNVLVSYRDTFEDEKSIEDLENKINEFPFNLVSYEDIRNYVLNYKTISKSKGVIEDESLKKIRTEKLKPTKIKEEIENYASLEDYVKGRKIVDEDEKIILEIVTKCYDNIEDFKRQNNSYTFTDISKMAIALVTNNEDVRNELQNKYKYIMLDEYQDTSDLQEKLLVAISHNNIYMVGDIKQSIYRFRNANPELFESKYNSYQKIYTKEDNVSFKNAPATTNNLGYRIDMIKNFRSRKEVLEDINTIFDPLMTKKLGNADYIKEHRMVFGFDSYNEHILNDNYHMDIFTYKLPHDKNNKETKFINDNEEYGKDEIEAIIVANDIQEKYKNFKIYDKKNKTDREAKYSDFCILTDTKKQFEVYRKVFEGLGIPLSINNREDMSKDDTTIVLTNLIVLIAFSNQDNLFDDVIYKHAFLSVARSYLSCFDDNMIYDILENKNENNEITIKAKKINSLIDIYSNSRVYLEALNEFDFFNKIIKTKDIVNKEHEAEYILKIIKNLDTLNYSFKDIALHLQDIINQKGKIEYSLDHSKEEGVKLMNIFQSKGLEFPVCYFTNLTALPNIKDETQASFDIDYGFLLPSDEENKKSLNSILTKNKIEKARKSERLRLFYVGLTRAEEKIILVLPEFKKDSIKNSSFATKFADYIAYDSYITKDDKKYQDINQYIKSVDLNHLIFPKIKNNSNLNDKLSLIYNKDFIKPEYIKNKMPETITKSNVSKNVIHLSSVDELNAMEKGTLIHEAMESIDFKNIDVASLHVASDIKETIKKVLKNKLFSNINNAKTYTEHEFSFDHNGIHYDGIIDLLAIYDDHIDIIDYKLFNIDSIEYDRQLSIYALYVQSKSNLPIHCYLLSLKRNIYREVKIEKI